MFRDDCTSNMLDSRFPLHVLRNALHVNVLLVEFNNETLVPYFLNAA